jgi:hypothetical protein
MQEAYYGGAKVKYCYTALMAESMAFFLKHLNTRIRVW